MRTPNHEELLAILDRGIKRGVANALQEHKRAGRSVVIWRDGKVVELAPEEIPEVSSSSDVEGDARRE